MGIHDIYMHRCLQLAALGAGYVAPNPMVGAVLVHENKIIGEAYHCKYGEAHAEVNCINSVPKECKHLIKESTLYVSLEPCDHFGKTPPCTELILEYRIPNVVIACADSSEKVNGSGIKKLKQAGVNVLTGILEKKALELNKRFFTFHKNQRPYIILKWAQSNNLKTANADFSRVMISYETTNRLVHKWRSEEAAILVGTRTAMYDNPSLTTRLWPGNDPVRFVIDKNSELSPQLSLFDNSVLTFILNATRNEEKGNTIYYKVEEKENMIGAIMTLLYQRNLTSLVVEGGSFLLQSFINAGCWDEARVITNKNLLIDNGIDAPVLQDNDLFCMEKILTDEVCFYLNTDLTF